MQAPHLLKNHNRHAVLTAALAADAPFSKRELADKTALTFPTVSKIVDELAISGQLAECGTSAPVNGRKAALYCVNPDHGHILCVYFQYENFFCTITDATQKILRTQTTCVQNGDYLATLEAVIAAELARDALIRVLSVGVPGGVEGGVIRFICHYNALAGFPLQAHLFVRFGLPTVVDRDMNAMVCGLAQTGDFPTGSVGLLLLTTDGPGYATLMDGKLLRGCAGFAGEVGYLPYGEDTNFEDVCANGFTVDLCIYAARLIVCIAALVNPRHIIVLQNEYTPDLVALTARCRSLLPPSAMPQIALCATWHSLYQGGLALLGRKLLFSEEHPV